MPKTETARKLTPAEWEDALAEDLAKNGLILLWSGCGKIPANFRGVIPQTLDRFLKSLTKERAISRAKVSHGK